MCKFVFWMFVEQNMDVPEISKLVKACLVHVFYGSNIMLNLFLGGLEHDLLPHQTLWWVHKFA